MSEEPTLDKVDQVAAEEDVAPSESGSKEEVIGGNEQKMMDLIIYSADDLMKLRQAALSQKWPPYLDEAFKNNRGTWDPDRWHQNKRRGSTPPPSEDGKDGKENKKDDKGNAKKDDGNESAANKKKDIKDRLFMTETEGIVLSPQRRSFITGCQVSKDPPKDQTSERNGDGTNLGKTLESSLRSDTIGSSVVNASARRVGSGRIRPSTTANNDDFDNRRPGNYHDSDSRFGGFRGGERPSDRGWYDQRNNPGMDRRNMGASRKLMSDRDHGGLGRKPRHRDSEPEWMSAPVDQDDMMELKGFDDSPEKETRAFRAELDQQPRKMEKLPSAAAPKMMEKESNAADFNIDDILHMDVIPGLSNILDDNDPLMELESKAKSESSNAGHGGSRFSQFFSKTSEDQRQKNLDQRRSSITDELKHDQNSMTSIKIPSPGDPSAYFAPISPAAKTEDHQAPAANANQLNPIMEMLRSGGKGEQELLGGHKAPPLPQMPDVKTAAELEANIKRMVGLQRDDNSSNNSHRRMSPNAQQQHPEAPGEMSAFKKFAAMIQGGSNGIDKEHENGGHAMSNKMNHQPFPAQQQSLQAPPGSMLRSGPVVRPSPIPANAPTEHDILEMAMRQHQSDMQRIPAPGIQPSRDDVLMMAAQRRLIPELLKTAEAISLQTAVQNQGMTMLNTILYQFVYGQMEPTRREILLQVIKYYQMKGAFGPQFAAAPQPPQHQPHFLGVHDSAISPTSPTPGSQQGKPSNLAVSPIPGRERIPSPQEIAIHTQQIMQNALIKRKLEEQKENYRRRQEQDQRQRGGTDSPSFAFTPTVVMKKMAADRRDSDPKIPELKVSTEQKIMQPPPPHLMASGQLHQQQQMLFMQQIRAQQLAALQAGQPVDPRILMQAQAMMSAGQAHGGQRPLAPPPSGSNSGPPRFMSPSEGGPAASVPHPQGGLSRFFSPEVLAQAQSGNAPPLPPLPTQKAMTLEEIERHAAAVRM